MLNFGDRIKRIRTDSNLSQQDFATSVGILSKQTISDVEKGKQQKLKEKYISKIIEIYEVEREWIEYGHGHMYKENAKHIVASMQDDLNYFIGNTSNSSNITQNSHNGTGDNALTAEEKTLIKYFRKRDEETQEKIMAYALTGKCD